MFTLDDMIRKQLLGLQPPAPPVLPMPTTTPALSPIDRGILGIPGAPTASATDPVAPPAPLPTSGSSLDSIGRGILGLGVGPLQAPAPPAGLDPIARQVLGLAPASTAAAPARAPAKNAGLGSIDAERQAGLDEQRAALLRRGELEAEQARASGEGGRQAEEQYRNRLAEDEAATAAYNQKIDARRDQLNADVEGLSNTKIDPHRLVHNMSTWQKIGSAIAIAIGGIPTAYGARTGNQNVALQIIQSQIDKDVQAQMQDLDTRRAAIGAKSTLLQQDIAAGRDAADARLKATVALRESAAREFEARAKVIGGEAAQAESERMAGLLRQQNATDLFHQNVELEQLKNQRAQVGIAAGHLKLAKQQAGVEQALKFAQLPGQLAGQELGLQGQAAETAVKVAQAKALQKGGGNPELRVPGVQNPDGSDFYVTGTKEEAGKARETMKNLSAVDALLKRRMELRNEYGSETLPSKAKDRMASLDRQLFLSFKALNNTGTLDDGSVKFLSELIGDTSRWSDISAQTDEVRQAVSTQAQAHLASLGYQGRVSPIDLRTGGVPGEDEGTISPRAPVGKPAPRGMPPLPPTAMPPTGKASLKFPPDEWFK